MGLGGLEPPTSRLSGVRSNQLSYRPTPRSNAAEIGPIETVAAPQPSLTPDPVLGSEPGRTRARQMSPAGVPARLILRPELQIERRIAHGPESPGGRPRICLRPTRKRVDGDRSP